MFDFYIKNFGKIPLCNKTVSRGFFIGKFCFPICTRCTSISLSTFLFYYIISYFFIIDYKLIIVSFLLQIPVVLDYTIQTITKKESSNFNRVITGIISGIGLAIFSSFFDFYFFK